MSVSSAETLSMTLSLWVMLWPLYLFIVFLGWGRYFLFLSGADPRRFGAVEALTVGVGLSSLYQTWILSFGLGGERSSMIWLLVGFVLGAGALRGLVLPRWRSPITWGLVLLLMAHLGVHGFKMLAPSGGQESFQYHYYLPMLYLDQGTLFLRGYELYDALLNTWAMESLLVFSQWVGGPMAQQMQLWFLFLLFALQVGRATWVLYDISGWWAANLALLCSVYANFLWWSKPELPLAGACLLLVAHLLKDGPRFPAPVAGVFMAWILGLKITAAIFVPALLLVLPFAGMSWRRVLNCTLWSLFFFLPWMVLGTMGDGGVGGLPASNPRHFSAPDASAWSLPYPLWQKYWQDLVFYFNLYKPAGHILVLGLPFLMYHWRRYSLILGGLLFSLVMAWLLLGEALIFADEFRYTGLALVVIPVGAGVLFHGMARQPWLGALLLLALVWLGAKRLPIPVSETLRYHRSFLEGRAPLAASLGKEGAAQLLAFREHRQEGDRLLHIGHGNVAVHGPEVVHVGSWSGRYPLWKQRTREELLKELRDLDVQWVLFERGRYASYARGFGGDEYAGSDLTAYYRESLRALELLEPFKRNDLSDASIELFELSAERFSQP